MPKRNNQVARLRVLYLLVCKECMFEYNNTTVMQGELGQPVEIDKEKLSPEERRKYDQGWKNNSFNLYASDMISLHRSLPDLRDQA